MEDKEVIEWLKKYFSQPKLDVKNIKPVLHFTLLWNLFEHITPQEIKLPYNEILRSLANKYYKVISDKTLDKIYNYFKKRYVKDNEINTLFYKLLFKKKESEECQNILLSDNTNKEDKLTCVLLIIYRFRNNLFHGSKNPTTLNLYSGQFKIINKFLMGFIEATADKNGLRKN